MVSTISINLILIQRKANHYLLILLRIAYFISPQTGTAEFLCIISCVIIVIVCVSVNQLTPQLNKSDSLLLCCGADEDKHVICHKTACFPLTKDLKVFNFIEELVIFSLNFSRNTFHVLELQLYFILPLVITFAQKHSFSQKLLHSKSHHFFTYKRLKGVLSI